MAATRQYLPPKKQCYFRTCGICQKIFTQKSIHRHVATHARSRKRRCFTSITHEQALCWWGSLPRVVGSPSIPPPITSVPVEPSLSSADSSPSSADSSPPSSVPSADSAPPHLTKDKFRLLLVNDTDFFERKVNPKHPERGEGLFSRFHFKKGDYLFEYHGVTITDEASKEWKSSGRCSHFITIDQHHVIVGWNSSDIETGCGVASLCNDPFGSEEVSNVVCVKVEVDTGVGKVLYPWSLRLGCNVTTRLVFRAKEDGGPGTEFLFNYGRQYWKIHDSKKKPVPARLTRTAIGSIPRRSYVPLDEDPTNITYHRRDFTVFQFLKSSPQKKSQRLILGIHTLLSSIDDSDQYGVWARVDIKKCVLVCHLYADEYYISKPPFVRKVDENYMFTITPKGPWYVTSSKFRNKMINNKTPSVIQAGCFINYCSDNPGKHCNVILRPGPTGGLAFYSRRFIFKGEELLGAMYNPAPPHLIDIY